MTSSTPTKPAAATVWRFKHPASGGPGRRPPRGPSLSGGLAIVGIGALRIRDGWHKATRRFSPLNSGSVPWLQPWGGRQYGTRHGQSLPRRGPLLPPARVVSSEMMFCGGPSQSGRSDRNWIRLRWLWHRDQLPESAPSRQPRYQIRSEQDAGAPDCTAIFFRGSASRTDSQQADQAGSVARL